MRVSLADLKPGQGKKLDWEGKPLWLVRRPRAWMSDLRDVESEVQDPYSENKPLPGEVSHIHRGLTSDYLLVFAVGDRCEVGYVDKNQNGPAGRRWAGWVS